MRKISRALAGVSIAVAAVAMTASPAQASASKVVYTSACRWCAEDGHGTFIADPAGQTPGDSIRACDLRADGYAVKEWLYYKGKVVRTATTEGHSSKYCTPWKSGNLQEEVTVGIKVCKVKGATTKDCFYGEGQT